MNIWAKILGNKGIDVANKVSDVVDRFVHTPDEKIEAKKAMLDVFNNAVADEQKNISERWNSDMTSDNALSKSVRPAVLIFLIFCTTVLIFIDSSFTTFVVDDEWKELLKLLLMTTVAAYFGGRSYEKGTKIKNK